MNSYVVFYETDSEFAYVWNNSHTVNVFYMLDPDAGPLSSAMDEIDVFTLYPPDGSTPTYDQVYAACVEHEEELQANDAPF